MKFVQMARLALLACWLSAIPGCRLLLPELTVEIPPGYAGWVRVDLELPTCPQRGSTVHVSREGTGCLAGSVRGWTVTDFKYEGDATKLDDREPEESRRIWAQSTIEWTDKVGSHRALSFFVGTHAQLLSTAPPKLPRVD
jgi:hypothetical protein